ncbi:MAG TPA: 1-deoxy-D-xylulose-5-phosphate reductoisomerase [Rhodothermales bacterium]
MTKSQTGARPGTQEGASGAAWPRGLAVLGSTGSIGTQTLDVVRLFRDRFQVRVLTANSSVETLLAQVREFSPECVVVDDEAACRTVRDALNGTGVRVLKGTDGLCEAVSQDSVDTVVAAIVGVRGLVPVLAAIDAGKRLALANKETLVVGGELVRRRLAVNGGVMLPIDSEHSAILQCLAGESASEVESLILTASGGPFRTLPAAEFDSITPERALRHPNWTMGAKITIDSATMMNKGLEVIEARWLFDLQPEQIHVLVHPQSLVHSMVSFRDGSTKAQLGLPDMRVPIQYALSYPERWPAPHPRIDWKTVASLDFEEPDLDRFPCLPLAYEALRIGGTAPAVLNAANEESVALFLARQIRFTDIPRMVSRALEQAPFTLAPNLDDLLESDAAARRIVQELSTASAY